MHVKIYSHNFAVTDYGRFGYEFLKNFGISNFGETDYRAVRMNRFASRLNREPQPVIKRTYATSLNNGREFRFHINCLGMFKEAISRVPELRDSITYEIMEYYTPIKIDLKVLDKYIARDEQIPLIEYLKSPGYSKVLTLRTGGGKMQDPREPVLTPTGWRPIGELVPGDKVITPKGMVSTVLSVYNHVDKQLYTVTTEDGRQTIAGGEHLWGVYYSGNSRRYVVTTDDIKARLERGSHVFIPAMSGWDGFSGLAYPDVDPWLYGFLYITATRRVNVITTNTHSVDLKSILENCARRINAVATYTEADGWKLTQDRKQIDLYARYKEKIDKYMFNGLASKNTEIPDELLNGSYTIRKELLAGILRGLTERNRQVADSRYRIPHAHTRKIVLYLCHSLGYGVTLHHYENPHRNQVDKRRFYEIDIDVSSGHVEISNITYSHTGNAVCIAIDDPEHLYVTRDFIATHNTYCALQSAADIGGRIVITIEKRFFNLWEEALCPGEKQILDLKVEEVMFVSGSKELKQLMELAIEDRIKDIKVIIIASRTLAIFFETYERYGKYVLDYYPVKPIEFYELLQATTRIKDELHLSLHANFIEELYLHGAKSFSLSATLEDGSFRDKILAIMFPHEMRAPATTLVKYISCTALLYSLNQPDKAEYTLRGQTDYNHNQYEKWLLKDKQRTKNYLSIASDWVNHRFIKVKQPGQRAAIFATSVEMATRMLEFLKYAHPDLNIARYAASAGDIYDEARQADLLITTVQSFGTGFDLDGLICCLMTSSINSRNTNIQVLGRLRELRKWPDLVPVFDYLVCVDIPKQMAYHEEKMKQFEGRVKDHKTAYVRLKV